MKKIRILALSLLLIVITPLASLQAALNPEVINKNKKGVLSIRARSTQSAYNSIGSWSGTGFVVDKKKGIILTNNHVIGTASASTFEVTFFNGKELDATILYMDPVIDFGFLKVDPAEIPDDVIELELSGEDVHLNQPVLMIGKNEGQNFSINVGHISSLYESVGHYPNQSYRISLNAQGGASGSPVITDKGKIIALTHSSNLSSSSFALPITYIMDALKSLREDKTPKRRFSGAFVTYHSLDRSSSFNNFPKKLIKKYMKDYPDALNRALLVKRVFPKTPANGKLQLGDVIWEVNGEEVGPNLYKYDKLMNASEEVTFTIYRADKKMKIKVKTYDMEANKIKRLVSFGGATFYEADHFTRLITGAPYGAVFLSNIQPGTSFYDRFPPISGTEKLFVNVVKLNGQKIKSLKDLIKILPDLKKKEDFYAIYNNYAFYTGHTSTPMFSTHNSIAEVSYNELDGKAKLYEFDEESGKWQMTEID